MNEKPKVTKVVYPDGKVIEYAKEYRVGDYEKHGILPPHSPITSYGGTVVEESPVIEVSPSSTP